MSGNATPIVPSSGTGTQPNGSAAKKILRYMGETTKRLDEYASQCTSVPELFSLAGATFILRMRLKDLVLRAVRVDPLGIGFKALELGWRKVFYEPVAAARQIRKDGSTWSEVEVSFLDSHLVNGIGHYGELIRLILHDYGVSRTIELPEEFNVQSLKSKPDPELDEWAISTIHKCIVYLGDLSRYRLEFEDGQSNSAIAERYYHLALDFDGRDGSPFNQLAALAVHRNHGLDSVYFYFKCLSAPRQFKGCLANLKKLSEKNLNRFSKLEHNETGDESERCAVYFLRLIHEFFFETSTKSLSSLCQKALQATQRCLCHPEGKEWFSKDIAMKMLLVLFLLLERLKDGQKVKSSMLRAYLLALFSHFVSKFLGDLYFTLFGAEAMVELFENEVKILEEGDEKEVDDDDEVKKKEESKKKTKAKGRVRDLLRRRKRRGSGDSDSSSASSSSAEESNTDNETNEEYSDDEAFASSATDDSDQDVIVESTTEILSAMEIAQFCASHHLMEVMITCTTWIMQTEDLVTESGDASGILWLRLSRIFNIVSLQHPELEAHQDITAVREKLVRDEIIKLPLPEDRLTRGIGVLGERGVDWNRRQKKLSVEELGTLRIVQLEKFGDWLCQIPHSRLEKNDRFYFVAKGRSEGGASTIDGSKGAKDVTMTKVEMMENMAQLWLEQEVKDLEGKDFNGLAHYSPYLVVDHLTLSSNLSLLRDVVASRKFITIVPASAVQQLDSMKRSDNGARNAIRWLERQFREGSRWVRAQKPHESRRLPDDVSVVRPKKRHSIDWHYFKIVECCFYFSHMKQVKSSFRVTLISSARPDTFKEFSATDLASQLDLPTETLESFASKNGIVNGGGGGGGSNNNKGKQKRHRYWNKQSKR